MNFDNIPQYVKENAEFCCWRYETVNNKHTKVPYNPRTGSRASVSKPATFTDFTTAAAASLNYSGIGIRVSNRIIGIDLDHCIKDSPVLPWSFAIVQMFPHAYIEINPSGTGLRILCLAPDGYTYDTDIYYIKRGNIEVYVPNVTTRFVTVTGNVYQNSDIVECTESLQWLLDTHIKRPTPKAPPEIMERESYLSDESVLDKALTAKNSEKFKKLWAGDITGYPSQSEADQALCSILAFYCNGNFEQIDKLFRQSGLIRDKWDSRRGGDTYGRITIHNTVSGIANFYTPVIRNSAIEDFDEHMPRLEEMKPENTSQYPWTDIGAGRLFADFYKNTLRYVPESRIWFYYEDGIWKTYRKSYKQKKQMKNDPSEWVIFENTHEAIIEEPVFEVVQKIRDGRRRLTPMGEMPILSSMLFCADCGNKLYQVRGRGWEHEKEHFVCATYRKIKGGCSSHQIRNVVVEELLLDGIRRVTSYARDHEDEFVQMVTMKTRIDLDKSMRDGKGELEQSQARISKFDDIIQRLYEDNIEGKISDERFAKMTANYEAEQHTLESRVAELKSTITSEKESALGVDYFLALVRKYTDIKELTAEIIREFVEKIYVYKAERIDGRRVQRIKIVYNCIGKFDPPASTSTTEQEKSA